MEISMLPLDWAQAVIEVGRRYKSGEITPEEMYRRMAELRSRQSMALIDAVDEIELAVEDELGIDPA